MLVLKELNIVFDKNLPNKKTARCPEQIIGHDEKGNRYLVVFAKTECQKFYAKRSVENMQYFSQIVNGGYKINMPVFSEEINGGYYAVYKYFDSASEICNCGPHDWLLQYYKTAELVDNTVEVTERIETDFLGAWPEKYRDEIRSLDEFTEYHDELKKHKTLHIGFQHGDFTPNNLLRVNGENYIMDFEFSQKFQPVGFDLYDFHYATDKKFKDVPYLKINEIKERLQNRANQLVDDYASPVLIDKSEYFGNEDYFANDLIYNQPTIYGENNAEEIYIRSDGVDYKINYIIRRFKAELCVWLYDLPAIVLNFAVEHIFKNKRVLKISINYATVNIGEKLTADNNWVVFLPEKAEDIIAKLSKKSQYNLRREMRLLEEQNGALSFESYKASDIPEEIFKKYFMWKLESHGTEYGMTGEEYINHYHVTDGMALCAGDLIVAILFYCKLGKGIYLENISYDVNFAKYSPGIILYEKFLENVTDEGSKVVFLGNGNQLYKTRFGAKEFIVYSGSLYRDRVFKYLNEIKRKIQR